MHDAATRPADPPPAPSTGAPTLSVVIPVRNRAGTRLENCLRSLRWQQFDGGLEVVVSDFGSDASEVAPLQALCDRQGARLVRTETDALWNRSRALNVGIQASAGRYVLCTDADMLFSPDFADHVVRAQREADERALVLCRCHDLPEEVEEVPRALEEFDALRAKASVRQTSGTGACQVATRAFFVAVRGYDEGYEYWGAEDNDMVSRATRYGLQPVWLPEAPAMLHQWHPTMKNDRPFRRKWNEWRYRLTRRVVVKNRKGWGSERG